MSDEPIRRVGSTREAHALDQPAAIITDRVELLDAQVRQRRVRAHEPECPRRAVAPLNHLVGILIGICVARARVEVVVVRDALDAPGSVVQIPSPCDQSVRPAHGEARVGALQIPVMLIRLGRIRRRRHLGPDIVRFRGGGLTIGIGWSTSEELDLGKLDILVRRRAVEQQLHVPGNAAYRPGNLVLGIRATPVLVADRRQGLPALVVGAPEDVRRVDIHRRRGECAQHDAGNEVLRPQIEDNLRPVAQHPPERLVLARVDHAVGQDRGGSIAAGGPVQVAVGHSIELRSLIEAGLSDV